MLLSVRYRYNRDMSKILIITSDKTGSGHRSSANAIHKKLEDRGHQVCQLDVFPLMGKTGMLMENSYIPLTTRAPFVYYLCQRFSEYFPWFIHMPMYFEVRKNLMKVIKELEPDMILSVHCMFTRAISYLIRKEKLNIPFCVGVIDLVEPPKVWEDRKADLTFVPTETIRKDYLKRGFAKEKVVVSGFPVRDDIVHRKQAKRVERPIHILMVNASTDLKKNIRFLEEISRLKGVTIDFVCGLDERMHETLLKMKEEGQLKENVKIYGFIDNVNELLDRSHILLTKAGPNMIMEALYSGTAIIVTGHIKGQEDHNYRYVTENGYGLKCEDPEQIYETVNRFIEAKELEGCLKKIAEGDIRNGAEVIADSIEQFL